MDPTDLIWMNGDFVPWEDAKVHVLTHGLHYGTGVFDSMRCYETDLNPTHPPAVFRNVDHLERLVRSAALYYMPVPYTVDQLRAATLELVARNGLSSCYIRPIVNRGYGSMGLNPLDAPVDVTIACWEWGTYLGEEGMRNGVRAKVSSWRRISPDSLIPHAKATGQYLNSVLAKVESVKAGYEEAILLDDHGHVCEGTGENVYVVRDGEIATPGQHNSILDGITRRSVIQIAQDLGYTVIERNVSRAEMYLAEEVFLSGTAAELVPVREIDDHTIGTGRAGRGHARAAGGVRRRDPRALRALPGVARRGERTGATDPGGRGADRVRRAVAERRERLRAMSTIELYDATLRDGMGGGGLSLTADEKLRVVHALDELGIDLIEAGFPASNPKERAAVRAARARDARAARRSWPSG